MSPEAILLAEQNGGLWHDCDDVMGWQTPEQVFALMVRVAEGTVHEYERVNETD